MESIPNALVTVIFDPKKRRPRVQPVNLIGQGFVRFPKELRELGALYAVDELRRRPDGGWSACGKIRRVA